MNVAGIHPDGKFLLQVMEIARDLTDKKLLLTGVEYAHQIERYSAVCCAVVCCGVLWCAVLCCGVVWCDVVWCGVV